MAASKDTLSHKSIVYLMRKLAALISIMASLLFSSCTKFDDSKIWETLTELEKRIYHLEELCKQTNSNIIALQAIVASLEENKYITNISPINKDGETIGYTISFSDNESITIFHGEDGKESVDGTDGHTPQISVKKDTDGVYYWTIDGEWMTDADGKKIRAIGKDGEDGKNGEDGKDGITPRLKIEDGNWLVSYDEGNSWIVLGKATGDNGTDGEDGADGEDGQDGTINNIFSSITQDENYVYFNLVSGEVLICPKQNKNNIVFEDLYIKAICCKKWDTNNDGELSYDEATAVNTLGSTFKGDTRIISFAELQYFTGLTYIHESAFEGCSSLWKIVIPKNVTDIRARAFYGCSGLSTINIPAAVTNIGDYVFYNCSALKNTAIPKKVTSIGKYVFYNCAGTLTIGCNIADSFAKSSSSSSSYYSYTSSYHWLYESDFSTIKIENTVSTIGGYAFKDLPSTTKIEVAADNTIKTIGQYAFYGCSMLTKIPMNSTLTSIGTYAFYNCAGLTEINIPDSVTSLGSYAFYNCAGLQKATLGKNISAINDYTFYGCPGLTAITLPDKITSIGKYAFYNCSGLTTIAIPDSVTTIGSYAFNNCAGINTLTIGSAVTQINQNAFMGCNKLTTIYCKPTTPPGIYYYSSTNAGLPFNTGMKIYVPSDSFGYYMQYNSSSSSSTAATNWYRYEAYIESYDFI